MGEQRRRGGRGRSGKGGRIPPRREGGAAGFAPGEPFTSFPDQVGPIRVGSAIDDAAVERTLVQTLERERRQLAALQALAADGADPALIEVRMQVERHEGALEHLARDLGADLSGAAAPNGAAESSADLVTAQRLARLGWQALQRAAYATGDKRIDRVVKPVLRDKERHAQVLETYALRQATNSLFKELEE